MVGKKRAREKCFQRPNKKRPGQMAGAAESAKSNNVKQKV
ncbi:hypothetical protein JCM19237_6973 [Photobacterium aphoticum]|uniref:Uncharacterized protein n=1 Tax=Photobacterium aphoticum TaxID=754436 RepID=A0A090QY35_9GAMM|nr:hypothetical protein JCM19237_6973 [Photobacterium aphoticum]